MRTEQTSTLYLLSGIDLDSGYENTLSFATATAQNTYFTSKILASFDKNIDYNYLRAEGTIRVEALLDDIFTANYIMYKNEDKWYYAFITKKEYINNNATRLYIKIDILQTYMFDYSLKECFVEREHQDRLLLNSGTGKLNRIYNKKIENLDYGNDYQKLSCEAVDKLGDNYNYGQLFLVLCCKGKISQDTLDTYSQTDKYIYYCVPIIDNITYGNIRTANGDSTICASLAEVIYSIGDNANLISIYVVGDKNQYFSVKYNSTDNYYYFYGNNPQKILLSNATNHYIMKITNIPPRNAPSPLKTITNTNFVLDNDISFSNLKNIKYESKLLTNPYYYMKLTLNQGDELLIKNEYLGASYSVYHRYFLSPLPKSISYISGYLDNSNTNKTNILINNKISELPILSDAWQDYLTSNKASATTGVAVSAGLIAAGIATTALTGGLGALIGGSAILSGVGQISNTLIKQSDIKQSPDNIKNMGNNGIFDFYMQNNSLMIESYEILTDFKNQLYNYFYHFGYLAKEFKTPNINSRYYFNFIKTINCNLTANIDNEIKEEIIDIYNKGLTIWHYRDASTFKGINNFDYENVELSLIGG